MCVELLKKTEAVGGLAGEVPSGGGIPNTEQCALSLPGSSQLFLILRDPVQVSPPLGGGFSISSRPKKFLLGAPTTCGSLPWYSGDPVVLLCSVGVLVTPPR